jgi:hypothetical protein
MVLHSTLVLFLDFLGFLVCFVGFLMFLGVLPYFNLVFRQNELRKTVCAPLIAGDISSQLQLIANYSSSHWLQLIAQFFTAPRVRATANSHAQVGTRRGGGWA